MKTIAEILTALRKDEILSVEAENDIWEILNGNIDYAFERGFKTGYHECLNDIKLHLDDLKDRN